MKVLRFEEVIREGELYSLREVKRRLCLSDVAFREMRRQGFPLVSWGKRTWAIGHQVIKFLELGPDHATGQSEGDSQQPERISVAVEMPA